jgi:uncharacterized repeat protein (TIGR01451 family)
MKACRPNMVNAGLTIAPYPRVMMGSGWQHLAARWIRVLIFALCAALCVAFSQPALAQAVSTYVVTNDGAINGTTTCAAPLVRNFTVSDSFIVADVDLGVYAQHTWRGDIRMTLQAPDGTRVQLVNGDADATSGDNFNVRLDDSAAQLVNTDNATGNHSTAAPPPFANQFRPNAALSAFAGTGSNGTWRLEICDIFPSADNGNFRHAELYLTALPANFADLSLAKQLVGSPPVSGGAASWRLTVTNASTSPLSANGIIVRDTLPAGFVFSSASGAGSFNPATGDWTVGTLAPGQIAVITISGTVTATAGATLTNTAEIIASSAPDLDSTPNNGSTGEDDFAAATLIVQSGRAPGIAPILSCPAGVSVFDWDGVSWAAGSTDNTYAFAGFGNVRFQLANDGAYLNNAGFGGQSPTVFNALTGGITPGEDSLTLLADQTSLAGEVEVTITLPRAFAGVQFAIFDVDFFANQFADRVEVVGSNGGSTVTPTLTNGNVNFLSGGMALGDGLSADPEPLGNVVVTFTQPVDRIVVRYGNHAAAPANPGQQAIAIHDLTVCNPFTNLSITKVSAVISDPVNLTNNPKAIPGALVEYLIAIANTGSVATDPDSVVVVDDGPADAKLCQIARAGGPVVFNDPGGSGLTYSFAALGSAVDNLDFSDDDGASWTYAPTADGEGCDSAVTSFRVRPGGGLEAGRSFNLRVRYIIK